MKEKRFYKLAFISILGTAALSVIFSLIFFILDESIDGGTFMYILYYVKVVCDLLANFVGYSAIVYAMTHFGWYDSLKVAGIYFLSVLAYWIYQTITYTVFGSDISSTTATYGESVLDLFVFNAFYYLGQLIITLMVPVLILMLICRKYTKDKEFVPFDKFVTFKNPVQKAMGIFCITLAVINVLSFLFFNVLPFLIQEEFYIYFEDFKTIMLQSALTILENALLYVAVQYIVFILSFRFFDANLHE